MPLTYTLDGSIVEYLEQIKQTIETKKYWTSFTYSATFKSLQVAIGMIDNKYKRLTGYSLQEYSRILFDGTQGDDIETFVNYYSGFLFVRKLENRLRWHQKYGRFPD